MDEESSVERGGTLVHMLRTCYILHKFVARIKRRQLGFNPLYPPLGLPSLFIMVVQKVKQFFLLLIIAPYEQHLQLSVNTCLPSVSLLEYFGSTCQADKEVQHNRQSIAHITKRIYRTFIYKKFGCG